jgi:predicted nucleic acid-binding protein
MHTSLQLVYIDTNVFLNSILYNPTENIDAQKALLYLQQVVKGEIKAVTSTLTWDEFVWIINKKIDRETSNQKGQQFLEFPNLLFEKVSLNVIKKAQDLLLKYSIRPRDGIHLATALVNRIQNFVTFDSDFDDISEVQIINLQNQKLE